MQLPADGHDTEWMDTPGLAFDPAGSGASIPADQTPPDWLNTSPGK
jgi:hypothetical protein